MQPSLRVNSEELPALVFPNGRELLADFAKDPRYNRKLRGKNELLAKAVGLKSVATAPLIWDMTLGLGEDAWTLARLGCQVVGFEREPLLQNWLQISFEYFKKNLDPQSATFRTATRLQLVQADSVEVLSSKPEGVGPWPDVIYFDPMYSGVAKNSALPRIEMQLLRAWLGEDEDPAKVLRLALTLPSKLRVVVKRPHRAEELAPGVTHAFAGEKVRYDMYKTFGDPDDTANFTD